MNKDDLLLSIYGNDGVCPAELHHNLALAIQEIKESEPIGITVEDVLNVVTDYVGLTIDELSTKSRKPKFVISRQITWFLIKRFKVKTWLVDMGNIFNKDHATVINGLKRIDNLMFADKEIIGMVGDMSIKLRELIVTKSKATNNKEMFLKELTRLCRKHRLEIDIDVHSVELSLSDINVKNKHFADLDEQEYKLNGNNGNFGIQTRTELPNK